MYVKVASETGDMMEPAVVGRGYCEIAGTLPGRQGGSSMKMVRELAGILPGGQQVLDACSVPFAEWPSLRVHLTRCGGRNRAAAHLEGCLGEARHAQLHAEERAERGTLFEAHAGAHWKCTCTCRHIVGLSSCNVFRRQGQGRSRAHTHKTHRGACTYYVKVRMHTHTRT